MNKAFIYFWANFTDFKETCKIAFQVLLLLSSFPVIKKLGKACHPSGYFFEEYLFQEATKPQQTHHRKDISCRQWE